MKVTRKRRKRNRKAKKKSKSSFLQDVFGVQEFFKGMNEITFMGMNVFLACVKINSYTLFCLIKFLHTDRNLFDKT